MPAGSRTITVLVIDDEPALLRMVRANLRAEGFAVQTSLSGLEALALLDANQPDVIVLDLQMPGMNGRDCFKEIRARGIQTPVIIFSAFDAEAARAELGAEAAIDKPFDPARMGQVIRRLVRG